MRPFGKAEQTLLTGGYAVALLLLIVPIADAILATWPPAPGALQWRFGMLGLIGNSLSYPVLAMLIGAMTARALENRGLLRFLSVAGIVIAVLLLASVMLFATDTLQLRAGVRPEMKQPFTAAAIKSGGIFVVSALIFAWLALGAHRSAKGLRGSTKHREESAAERKIVVKTPAGSERAPAVK